MRPAGHSLGASYAANLQSRLRVLYFLLASPLRLQRGRCHLLRSFLSLLDLPSPSLAPLYRLLLLGEFGFLLLGRGVWTESLLTARGHELSGYSFICFLKQRL